MAKRLKTRKRYRLIFVNDNTLNTVWTLRLSRAKVWSLTALCVAAIAALVLCVVVWSPVSYLLPGYMRPELRRTTVNSTLRVDSLLDATRERQLYLDNIAGLLAGVDSIAAEVPDEVPAEAGDTLLVASENERAFVESWVERERGNLSVLTPIVAEGMSFRSPAVGAVVADRVSGQLLAARNAPVVAIQDGMVVGVTVNASAGLNTIIIQHANDFVSVYDNVADVTVAHGVRVDSGRVIGRVGKSGRICLSVWHMGRKVDLSLLLPD